MILNAKVIVFYQLQPLLLPHIQFYLDKDILQFATWKHFQSLFHCVSIHTPNFGIMHHYKFSSLWNYLELPTLILSSTSALTLQMPYCISRSVHTLLLFESIWLWRRYLGKVLDKSLKTMNLWNWFWHRPIHHHFYFLRFCQHSI